MDPILIRDTQPCVKYEDTGHYNKTFLPWTKLYDKKSIN